jgi:cytochrome P450
MDIDPIPQVWQDDPAPVYRTLREEHPVYYCAPRDLWVLTRYGDIQNVIRSPEGFSSALGVVPSGFAPEMPTIITVDPPVHTLMRRAVQRAFTPRRIAELEERVHAVAIDLLDTIDLGSSASGAEIDAFAAFTDPLPFTVLAELIGVDHESHDLFKRCGDAMTYATDLDPEESMTAARELTDYLAEVFVARRKAPREDLISVLLTSSPEGDALADEELLGLILLLSVAGTETTTSGLGNALVLFDRYRDDRRRIIEDPSLLAGAVDEVLRFDTPVQGLSRVATTDMEVDGVHIPRGARIHLLFAAANRDPEVFADPDRFDITRTPNNHLAFGFGIHHCVGATLARMEMRVGLSELLARWPDYAVVSDGVVRRRSDTNRAFSKLTVALAG